MPLNFSFKKSSSVLSDSNYKPSSNDDFVNATNLFSAQRRKAGISLEKLSKKTNISRNVLVSIENGGKKNLPENTYLISMLKILETELNLESGSLNGLLDQKVSNKNISRFEFNFINIDFLDNWTGSLLYLIFMFLSILALNSQQKYLLKINSISTEPIIIEKTLTQNKNIINNKK